MKIPQMFCNEKSEKKKILTNQEKSYSVFTIVGLVGFYCNTLNRIFELPDYKRYLKYILKYFVSFKNFYHRLQNKCPKIMR